MCDEDVVGAITIKVTRVDTHACFSFAVAIDRSAGQQRVVTKCSVLLVNPKLIRIPIIRNVNVYPTILVEIRCDHPQPMTELFIDTGLDSYVCKSAIASVVKEPIAWSTKHSWRAIVFRRRRRIARRTVGN